MVRVISNLKRAMIVGRLQAGQGQVEIARYFGVSQSAVSKLKRKFIETNYVKDRPRPGRPGCFF